MLQTTVKAFPKAPQGAPRGLWSRPWLWPWAWPWHAMAIAKAGHGRWHGCWHACGQGCGQGYAMVMAAGHGGGCGPDRRRCHFIAANTEEGISLSAVTMAVCPGHVVVCTIFLTIAVPSSPASLSLPSSSPLLLGSCPFNASATQAKRLIEQSSLLNRAICRTQQSLRQALSSKYSASSGPLLN